MSVVKLAVKCPHCKEPIIAGSTRCKHCHAELVSSTKKTSPLKKLDTFRAGFLSGLLFSLLIALIGWLHFTS
ncbi:MAG: hypothetical protein P1R58_10655 [bacterium]|nr:hypothetical protein [bacterium]